MILPAPMFRALFITGYGIMAVGLVFSNFMMSVSQFVLAGAWLLEGNLHGKCIFFFRNRTALSLSVIFFIHAAGMAWTHDFGYGIHDLRVKLPLFILPLIMSTVAPLPKKWFDRLACVFILSVLVSTLISTSELSGFNNVIRKYLNIPQRILFDNRSISLFISHIRFSLLVCTAVGIIIHRLFINREDMSVIFRWIFMAITLWFIIFLFLLESLTGIIIISIIFCGIFFLGIVKHKRLFYKALLSTGFLLIVLFWVYTVRIVFQDPCPGERFSYRNLESHTTNGNLYSHDTLAGIFIHCNPVWVYISWPELSYAWAEKSSIPFEGRDLKGQEIKYTLINFLTSKGLRKDEQTVRSLTPAEITAIEKGVTDYRAACFPAYWFRIEKISEDLREYLRGSDPAGSSVIQRFEFWKTAWEIIRENPFTGVGTGDVRLAYKEQYRESGGIRDEKWQLRAHNQFLAIGVALGIPGIIIFLLAVAYPVVTDHRNRHFLYIIFLVIATISFLNEDTLESQAGISFFTFFSCLFLFQYVRDEKLIGSDTQL